MNTITYRPMNHLKFRAWNKQAGEWHGASDPNSLTFYDFHLFGECTMICSPNIEDIQHLHITQFSGLQDSAGVDIYEGDYVYLAGTGVVEMKFPFIDLYEAGFENDIGWIRGNIFEGRKGKGGQS